MPVPVIAKPRKGLWQSVFLCIGGRIPTTSLRTGLGMTGLRHFATGPWFGFLWGYQSPKLTSPKLGETMAI